MNFFFKKKATVSSSQTLTTQSHSTVTVTTRRTNADGTQTVETVTKQTSNPTAATYFNNNEFCSREFVTHQTQFEQQKTITKPPSPKTSTTTRKGFFTTKPVESGGGAKGGTIIDVKKFRTECLKSHNEYRKKHRVNPLALDESMCAYAQEWANEIAKQGRLQHRPSGKYGENIYWSSGMTVDGTTAVTSWYNEIKDYKFGSAGGFNSKTGHFTQVVWKNSKKLGVGYCEKDRQIFVVANYDPPGNYRGEYDENVLPLK